MEDVILDIIYAWSDEGYWYGYDSLAIEVEESTGKKMDKSKIQVILKRMREENKLVVRPIFSERTGMLNGSAYFKPE